MEFILPLSVSSQTTQFIVYGDTDNGRTQNRYFMEKLDIYINRLGAIPEGVILDLPIVGQKAIDIGFLGIELSNKEVYKIYTSLGEKGIDSAQIIPIKYKHSILDLKEGQNIVLHYFQEVYNDLSINEMDIRFLRKNIQSYSFTLSLPEVVIEPIPYVSIDKSDGHIHSKYEQYTVQQEEYYLDILTDLSLTDIESVLLKKSHNKAKILLSNNGNKETYFFETLYVEPCNCRRKYELENGVSFKSNIRLFFYIPKYKVGYKQGHDELLSILHFLKAYVNKGILFANFEDFFVLNLNNDSIFFNKNWKYWE